MNILFLSLLDFSNLEERNLYTDLLREFLRNGHHICAVSPVEKRNNKQTHLIEHENLRILKLKIGNIQKTNIIEKGISTFLIEKQLKAAVKKFFTNVKFDLILYSTPPITFAKTVEYIKNRDNCLSYLILKDIFPQGAVDLGVIRKDSLIFHYFRKKERKLYAISDFIGCMSLANVEYLLHRNPEIKPEKVELCPNSIEPTAAEKDDKERNTFRKKYNIPLDSTVFIYGGNLGKPQGADFLCECLKANKDNYKAYFVIAGSGTEYKKLKFFIDMEKLGNAQLLTQLPKSDYDMLVNASDIGLIFLDRCFTIPNFPSRLLSYMQASLPVLAATDINTDVGKVIEKGNFGFWCESSSVAKFNEKINLLCDEGLRKTMGANARRYLEDNYTVKHSYNIIMRHFE